MSEPKRIVTDEDVERAFLQLAAELGRIWRKPRPEKIGTFKIAPDPGVDVSIEPDGSVVFRHE